MAGLAGCSNANPNADTDDADGGNADDADADGADSDGSIGGAPMYQYTPANTGYAPAETGPSGSVTRRWTVDAVGGVRSSPAVVGGTVYVGGTDDSVYAIDAADGGDEWEFQTGGDVVSSPAVVDGTVYVGCNDDSVYAIDADTGEEEWAFETASTVKSSPTVAGGTVYVGSNTGTVYAIGADGGEKQWSTQTGSMIHSAPAVADGTVYVEDITGVVYALDGASGDRRWDFETSDRESLSISTRANGSPTAGDQAVDAGEDAGTSGTAYDRLQAASAAVDSSPTVHNGVVYARSVNGGVYAIDAESGEKRWAFRLSDANGAAAIAGRDDSLRRSNPGTGRGALSGGRRYRPLQMRSPVRSSSAVVEGTVYAASRGGVIYAVDADTGEQRWAASTDAISGSSSTGDGPVDGELREANTTIPDAKPPSTSTSTAARGVEPLQVGSPMCLSLVALEETLYVGDLDGSVYAVDRDTGDGRWAATVGDGRGSSLVVADDTVFVNGADGMVALSPE
jgi:outer membrane protein assembly factor BamB